MRGEARRHGEAGSDDGAELRRQLDAAVPPVELEPQRVVHVHGTAT